jgi:outer membrane immunogenic protein
MKKLCASLIGIAILMSLAPTSALAQDITWGGRLGLNMSTLSTNVDVDFKSKICYTAGVFATIGLMNALTFQPELLYSNKGAKYEETFEDQIYKVMVILNYLEMPLLFKYNFGMMGDSQWMPNVYAGPYAAYRLNGKFKVKFDGQTETEDINSDEMNTIDYGLVLGAGLDVPMGRGQITFDVRYSLGMANTAKNDPGENEKTRNRVLQALVGYSF